MHSCTRQALGNFVNLCNWSIPHPLDERRFHRFISTAYAHGDTRIEYEEFREALSGAQTRFIDEWYRRYEAGIRLLQVSRG